MANLVSPGVQVTVTDESVYGPTGAGTVPMLFIATGADKVDPTGTAVDGIAAFTKKSNAGKPVLVTSQRELTQYFGNVDFNKVAGTVQQGDETNEYGLLAAYSFLGQASAAYIVRADVDLTALRPTLNEPMGNPANNTYWVNPAASNWGIFEYTDGSWSAVTPNVEIVADSAPTTAVVDGEYLVVVNNGATETSVKYFKGNAGSWDELTSATFAPHYSQPSSPSAGDTWIKTTKPGGGIDVAVSLFTDTAGDFISKEIVSAYQSSNNARYFQDGSGNFAEGGFGGDLHFAIADDGAAVIRIKEQQNANERINGPWEHIVSSVSTSEPVGAPLDGKVWFDGNPEDGLVGELAIFEVVVDNGTQKWARVSDVTYMSSAPAVGVDGAYWIDTDENGYPAIYRSNGTTWVRKDNSDQSTSNGVVFGDITANDTAAGTIESSLLASSPNPLLYPAGTTGVNMCRSGGTVRIYDASATTAWKWRNHAPNQANGAGSFGRHAQRAVIVAAMQASAGGSELREETVAMRLIAAPGYPELMDEMNTLNADRNETAFVVVDTPFRLNPTEAVEWVQGRGAVENGESGLVSANTYSAVYYPSVLTTNPSTGDSVVAPASHSVLFTYAFSDNISFQWFAPAGLTRGQVQNAANVGYLNSEDEFVPVALTQGHRDAMYENKLNPIARFPNEGIVVFGQKTLHPYASSLDRVNVARLTAYLRERFAEIARPFLFEPNDASTRENAKLVFEGFLANILQQRGIYDFAVVCNETNNTPARIDANEFYVDVAIEPTKSAEYIYIPVRIVNTGEL